MGALAHKGGRWEFKPAWLDAQTMLRFGITREKFDAWDDDERAYHVAVVNTERKIETLNALVALHHVKDSAGSK